jgi:hypothetical protein
MRTSEEKWIERVRDTLDRVYEILCEAPAYDKYDSEGELLTNYEVASEKIDQALHEIDELNG